MKIFLGIILVCLSTFLAYVLSAKFSLRKQFYNDFFNFNNKLKQEISFGQTTIVSLINNENASDFYCYLRKYLNNNTFDFDKTYLTNDEIEFYYNYIKTIGTGDKNSQIDFLDNVNTKVVERQRKSLDEEKKYKTLYIKLGFLFGLILFVLIL